MISTEELYERYSETGVVSTDTRKIASGSVFFALKGPKFNANEFAAEALAKGARYAVIDDAKFKGGDEYLLVEDGLTALQKLANYHRRQLDIPFIGITGSNGKTTTKELINAVLSKKYKTYSTVGNLNNHIGVPLTILAMDKTIEIAIVEMGANSIGEIKALSEIAEPTHGVITNIGKAHLEGFGGFDGVIRAKSELYDFLLRSEGVVFINSQNEILKNMGKRFKDPYYYPAESDFLKCEFLGADPFIVFKSENGEIVETNLLGKYNFDNIAAALCIGKFFEVPADKANEAVKNYVPSNNRSQIIKKGSNTIVLDAYNANPSSMKAALENFKLMKNDKKVVLLGDMFELGEESETEHAKLGEILADENFGEVLLCGKNIKAAHTLIAQKATYFENRDELNAWLDGQRFQDTLFLIKASRGIGLETAVDHIK